MPFKSKAQMKAAFGGYLGEEMKDKAPAWADETENPKKLPMHVSKAPKAMDTGRRGRRSGNHTK